jgi:lysophospholipase L1-like esterase
MKALYLILFTVTAFSGCSKKGIDNTTPATVNMNNKDTTSTLTSDSLHYLALGDSYTIGESVPQSDSYPYQLTNSLRQNNFLNVKPPTIIAVTGWTTDNLIDAINNSGLKGKTYDVVTLLIGVNDQFQGLSQDNYKIKFAQVLKTAIAFAKDDSSRVFVLSIPDYGVTPFAGGNDAIIGPQIDQFNAINQAISLQAHVHYLNITTISRTAANHPELIAVDGLHPSGEMYSEWVQVLAPMVAARLKSH